MLAFGSDAANRVRGIRWVSVSKYRFGLLAQGAGFTRSETQERAVAPITDLQFAATPQERPPGLPLCVRSGATLEKTTDGVTDAL